MEAQQIPEYGRDKRFALLIDADNVSAKYIKPILNELNKYGTVTYKRIYGDWTLSLHAKWKDALLENSITPIQQFSYTYGKNSTDSAMIIDAMDILYAGGVEGFCIVSSDSDFTRLASRLRESGRTVIGMGEKKTPTPFRKACDIFTVLELLVKNERSEKANGPTMSKAEVEQAVVDIIIDNQNNGKATGLGEIGSRLQKRYPDFDVRNYGTNLLSKLLSEFTRVKITKDHSSVAVELTDAAEVEKASNGEAKAESRVEESVARDAAEPVGEEVVAEAEGAEAEERKPSRRSRRSRRLRANREEGVASKDEAAEDAAEAEATDRVADAGLEVAPVAEAAAEVVAVDAAVEAEAVAPEAAAEVEVDSAVKAKPARKPRRRKKAEAEIAPESAAPEAPELVAPEAAVVEPEAEAPAAEPVAEAPAVEQAPAPARKPRRRKKAEAEAALESAMPEVSAPAMPEASANEPAMPEASANDPAALIRNIVTEAGPDGIALTKLGEDIRVVFKDFKVRDLGFPQLRLYIASVEDFELVKDGKAFRVKIRS